MPYDQKRSKSRSPIKAPPLRAAGQSVGEELDRLIKSRAYPYLFAAVCAWLLAGLETWKTYTHAPPSPIIYFALAIAVSAIAFWRILAVRKVAKRLRLAQQGERTVGQYLERLRESGFHVFHDVVGEGFNIDHVLIGEKGVYAIETKTRSKPARGDSKIHYANGQLFANGHRIDRNPLVQGRAAASWLSATLNESTGRTVPVHPVVLFPGWWVDPLPPGRSKEIWVLEPKALPAFLDGESKRLAPEDVKLLSFHLSRYVRQTNEPR
ncbi:MAG: nuclease-related domain-containing protein [Gammaproteobacteria bacterium]